MIKKLNMSCINEYLDFWSGQKYFLIQGDPLLSNL